MSNYKCFLLVVFVSKLIKSLYQFHIPQLLLLHFYFIICLYVFPILFFLLLFIDENLRLQYSNYIIIFFNNNVSHDNVRKISLKKFSKFWILDRNVYHLCISELKRLTFHLQTKKKKKY